MSSVPKLIRTALEGWAVGLDLDLSVTVNANPAEAGSKPALPTLACWFQSDTLKHLRRRVLSVDGEGNTVDHWGEREASVVFHFRLGNEGDADKVRDGFLHAAMYSALDAHTEFEALVVPLTITVDGEPLQGRLYFTGETRYATPEDVQQRDLWHVQVFATMVYPDVSQSPNAVGEMAISIEIDGETYHLSSGAHPHQSTPDV